jgi:hypothetical protein
MAVNHLSSPVSAKEKKTLKPPLGYAFWGISDIEITFVCFNNDMLDKISLSFKLFFQLILCVPSQGFF